MLGFELGQNLSNSDLVGRGYLSGWFNGQLTNGLIELLMDYPG